MNVTPNVPLQTPGAPRPVRSRVQVEPSGYEVRIDLPSIRDEVHPEACEALNHGILERVAKAQLEGEPLPGSKGSFEAGATVKQEGHLVSVLLSFDSYAGGAHPNTALQTVLYDAERGREVGLGDLFSDRNGWLQQVSSAVGAELARQPDIDEYFISSNASPSGENFAAFEPDASGLTFMLPAARSGPYGAGMFDAHVGWDQLRPSLDPRGPLWRESPPFAWDLMPAPQGQAGRQAYEQLLALRDPAFDRLDPKASERACEAATDYLTVLGQVREGADVTTLAEQFVRLHKALDARHQPEETGATFDFIEQGLRDGLFPDRTAVTVRFMTELMSAESVQEARQAVLRAPAPGEVPGTVERTDDSVVINGIRLPVNRP